MSKIFLDTNIILDIIDAQRPNNKKIHLLLEHLILNLKFPRNSSSHHAQ